MQEQRKRGRAGASTARSSIARQTHAFVTTSWQDLDIASGHSHARYARALGRFEVGVSSKVLKTFQELHMPSKALPRSSKKLPRASEASREKERERERKRQRETERERERERKRKREKEREREREKGEISSKSCAQNSNFEF